MSAQPRWLGFVEHLTVGSGPMPNLTDLGRALSLMRTGRGPHRQELRQRLAAIDPELRRRRNIERLKLANVKARLAMLDSRQDPQPLQAAAEASARRLATLDQRILEAIAAQLRPCSP
jgi:hypothetical protein